LIITTLTRLSDEGVLNRQISCRTPLLDMGSPSSIVDDVPVALAGSPHSTVGLPRTLAPVAVGLRADNAPERVPCSPQPLKDHRLSASGWLDRERIRRDDACNHTREVLPEPDAGRTTDPCSETFSSTHRSL
jgi:hypothetical protein